MEAWKDRYRKIQIQRGKDTGRQTEKCRHSQTEINQSIK